MAEFNRPPKRPFLEKPPKFVPPKRQTSWWLTAQPQGFTKQAAKEISPDDRIFTLPRLTVE